MNHVVATRCSEEFSRAAAVAARRRGDPFDGFRRSWSCAPRASPLPRWQRSTLEARRGSSMLAAWQNARGYVLAAGDATSARAWPFLCPNPMPVRSYEGRRGGAEGSGFLGGGRDVVMTV